MENKNSVNRSKMIAKYNGLRLERVGMRTGWNEIGLGREQVGMRMG